MKLSAVRHLGDSAREDRTGLDARVGVVDLVEALGHGGREL